MIVPSSKYLASEISRHTIGTKFLLIGMGTGSILNWLLQLQEPLFTKKVTFCTQTYVNVYTLNNLPVNDWSEDAKSSCSDCDVFVSAFNGLWEFSWSSLLVFAAIWICHIEMIIGVICTLNLVVIWLDLSIGLSVDIL